MKTPLYTPLASNIALVGDLDDATLRRGHALLSEGRVHLFGEWMDARLSQLEGRFPEPVSRSVARRRLSR